MVCTGSNHLCASLKDTAKAKRVSTEGVTSEEGGGGGGEGGGREGICS